MVDPMVRRAVVLVVAALFLAVPNAFPQNSKENADFKLAINLYNDGLLDLAAEQLKQFVASYAGTSQGIEARFYLGLSQQKLKLYDDARMTFQTFALTYQDNPKAPDAWWNTGECYTALRNFHEAGLAFERVKVFHPKSKLAAEALVRSGAAFLQAGERENARRVLRTVLQEYPSSPSALPARTTIAGLYFQEGNLEQAQAELKRVIEGDPSPDAKAQSLLLLANIQQATGKGELARSNYNEILQKHPGSSAVQGAHFNLGRLQAASGEYRNAAENFRKASTVKVQSDSALTRDALLELGNASTALGDYASAVASYERYLSLSTSDEQTPVLLWKITRAAALGKNFRKSGEAGAKLLRSAAPDSLKRRVQIRLALNAEEQKNAAQAVQMFISFAEQQPDDPSAPEILFRGAALAENALKDYRRAATLFELFTARYEHSPLIDDALAGGARCQERMKEFERAVTLYRKLAREFPSSDFVPEARERLRMIDLFESKDKDSGLEKLAQLVGDVVAQKDRAGLASRLGEIYFYDLKNYLAAARQLQEALDAGLQEPVAQEARFLRARALEYLTLRDPARRPDAIEAYQAYLAGAAANEQAFQACLSLFTLRSGTLPQAKETAAGILKRFPAFPRRDTLDLRLGVLLDGADSSSAARAMFSTLATSSSPSAEEAGYRLFTLLLRLGQVDSALAWGSSCVSTYPESRFAAKIMLMLADRSLSTGNAERAIDYYRKLTTTYFYTPEAVNATRKLADAYVAHGIYDEAVQVYGDLIQRRRTNLLNEGDADPDLLLAMGKAEYLGGNFAEARRYLFQMLARERTGPQAGEAYTTLGMIARSGGALDEATSFFRQAGLSAPSAPSTPDIADLLFQNGEYDDALKQYTKLLQTARSDSEHKYYEARIIVCRLKGDKIAGLDKEIAEFANRYEDSREEQAWFEVEKGNYYFRQKEYAKALQSYQRVASKFENTPSAPEALYWMGRSLEASDRPKEALEELNRLLENYPDAPVTARTHIALGGLYYTFEQWGQAIKHYRSIVDDPKADPSLLPIAMNNLIETYQLAGTNDAALSLTRKYLELFPNSDDRLDKRIKIGILYERLGYYDQAVLQLQSLLDEAGSDLEGEIRYYIAEANYNKGDYQQAILDFLKVPYLVTKKGKLDWTANSLYMSGQAYEKMGRYDQALTMYQQILDRSGIDEMFKNAARKEMERVRLVLRTKVK